MSRRPLPCVNITPAAMKLKRLFGPPIANAARFIRTHTSISRVGLVTGITCDVAIVRDLLYAL